MRNLKIHISTLLPRSSPRWRFVVLRKKRRNLYLLPSYNLRLLALPNRSRTATQKPTPVYVICTLRLLLSRGALKPEAINYITTGIYRCSILDFDLKFCENFRLSRISADKRFSMSMSHPTPQNPRPRAESLPAWSAKWSADAKVVYKIEK